MEKEKLKILILSQYFWPENFRINDLTKFLIKKKHEVEILTGLPNYPDGKIYKDFKSNRGKYSNFFGSKIYRVIHSPRKSGSIIDLFFNFATFFCSALYYSITKLRKKNYDYIIVFGTSPITTALIGINLSFFTRSKVVLWVLDLWPEVLKDLSVLNNNLIYEILKSLINYIYKKSDLILCQSENFYKKIRTKSKKIIFYTWPEEFYKKKIKIHKSQKFNIVFAGNMGKAQNLIEIIRAIKKINHKDIYWYFVGGGRYREKLISIKQKYNLTNLKFYPYQSMNKLKKFYLMSDALLLPLINGQATSNTIPGKFQTYLLYKKPILCHADGIVSDYVKNYKIGLCSQPKDNQKFIKNVEILYQAKKKKKLENLIKFDNFKKLSKKFEKKKILNNFELALQQFKFFKTIQIIRLNKLNKLNKQNFILSALNLAFLGSLVENKIKLNKNLICWVDGIMPKKIFNIDIPKIPGRVILENLKLKKNNKIIQVVGNLSLKNRLYLNRKFKNFKIKHISLPYGNDEFLKKSIKNKVKSGIIFMTLPTPKQELLASYLSQNLKNYRIYCFGAAINMMSGEEPPAPKIFEENFEFLWRLRFDTKRRIIRLLKNLTYFFYGISTNKLKLTFKIL